MAAVLGACSTTWTLAVASAMWNPPSSLVAPGLIPAHQPVDSSTKIFRLSNELGRDTASPTSRPAALKLPEHINSLGHRPVHQRAQDTTPHRSALQPEILGADSTHYQNTTTLDSLDSSASCLGSQLLSPAGQHQLYRIHWEPQPAMSANNPTHQQANTRSWNPCPVTRQPTDQFCKPAGQH